MSQQKVMPAKKFEKACEEINEFSQQTYSGLQVARTLLYALELEEEEMVQF